MDEIIPVKPSATSAPAYGEYPDPARRTLITVGLVLTTLMTSIDATIANTVLPQISRELLSRMAQGTPLKAVEIDAKDDNFVYNYR